MWIHRTFLSKLQALPLSTLKQCELPTVRVLLGPRQVGKTSLLERLGKYQLVLLDDLSVRHQATENPSFFLDQFRGPIILDEATQSPELFSEIKKRVDSAKRLRLKGVEFKKFDYWITGSNQTLMATQIQESLAGRAEFYNLNTLSIQETGEDNLSKLCLAGGWPELYSGSGQEPVSYLNGLISSFIERDIIQAAGIEKKAAFTRTLQLLAGSIGEMINFSEIAAAVGVESSTVQSWALILEQNQIINIVRPYVSNLNKRIIKTPKIYFEDVGLATRFQGWTQFEPLFVSPYFGHSVENIAFSELSRFFTNSGLEKKIYYIRNKEKIEVDFLIELPNKKFISIEVKTTPRNYSVEQLRLLESLKINRVEHWIVSPKKSQIIFQNCRTLVFQELFEALSKFI